MTAHTLDPEDPHTYSPLSSKKIHETLYYFGFEFLQKRDLSVEKHSAAGNRSIWLIRLKYGKPSKLTFLKLQKR